MIGETIGNFVIKSRLGRGGMGEVFLAEHKDLQTPVAIKILNEEISSDRDHVQRFFNEARVVSKIRHAGTVKIFDSGFVRGNAYLVMELLEGESLAARVARVGALPIHELVDIAAQIASVLDATHRSGVTHRDLKPDNIYLVKDDERPTGERVKILDFGIAKLSGTLASSSPKTSGTMGTPTYMAPEQWGDSSKVDWRADVYSLGCVAFELAAGRPPFVCRTIPEAYTRHLNEPPPKLSTVRGDVPASLDTLLVRLLAKAPDQRARSMGEIASAFAEIGSRRQSAPVATVASTLAPVHPPHTITTLGGSAGELGPGRPRRRMALGVVVGAVLSAGIIVVVAMSMGGSGDSSASTSAGIPTTQPTPTPQPAPQPTPAPAPRPCWQRRASSTRQSHATSEPAPVSRRSTTFTTRPWRSATRRSPIASTVTTPSTASISSARSR